MTVGSLFSGIGGLELGLERAGLGPVMWQAERDPYCLAVLRRHWPDARRFSDVREVGSGAARVDVVCGGFPCQPVSLAGRRLAQADERWLWPEFARVIRAVEPKVVVIENVPGLRTAGLRDVLADLADLGFDAEWTCVAAGEDPRRTHGWPHAGAPHERRRIFLVATHPDRVEVRGEQGWFGRACWEGASVSRDARASRALANASGVAVRERPDEARRWVSDAAWSGGGEDVIRSAADSVGEGLARPHGSRAAGRAGTVQRARSEAAVGETTVGVAANTDGEGQSQSRWSDRAVRGWASDSGWRDAPPAIRGVDDGFSDGLDGAVGDDRGGCEGEAGEPASQAPDTWRVSACGNAVVPQVAEIVGRAIVSACRWEAA